MCFYEETHLDNMLRMTKLILGGELIPIEPLWGETIRETRSSRQALCGNRWSTGPYYSFEAQLYSNDSVTVAGQKYLLQGFLP